MLSHDGGALLGGAYASIREMTATDAPLIVAWRNRDDVKKWLIRWEPLTLEAQLKWFEGARAQGDLLLMFETLDGEAVGTGSIYGFDRLRLSAEWGRLCAARIGGQPHPMMEACYLVHRICFEVLGMRRLHGALASENSRSYRLNNSLGYVQEGFRRKHWAHPEGYQDVIEIGLFSEEFGKQRPMIEKRLYRDHPLPEITDERAELIRRALSR